MQRGDGIFVLGGRIRIVVVSVAHITKQLITTLMPNGRRKHTFLRAESCCRGGKLPGIVLTSCEMKARMKECFMSCDESIE